MHQDLLFLDPLFRPVGSSSLAGCSRELEFVFCASSLYLSIKSNATLMLFGVHACAVLLCPVILQQCCTSSNGSMGRAFSVHAAPAASLWHTCFYNKFGVKLFMTTLPPAATVQAFVYVCASTSPIPFGPSQSVAPNHGAFHPCFSMVRRCLFMKKAQRNSRQWSRPSATRSGFKTM